MKMSKAFSTFLLLLALCALPLALAACGGGRLEDGQVQLEGGPEVRYPEERLRQEAFPGQQGEEQQTRQARQAAEELAEIEWRFLAQFEIYPGAIPDTSTAAAQTKEAAGGDWILRTGDATERVARFYDDSLRRMSDLDRKVTPYGVIFSFTDLRGDRVRIEVVQAGPDPRDGTYIILGAG